MATILLAEDEPDIRELLKFTLTFGGYEVHTRKNGAEAVEAAPTIMPDLIMLDVRMPRMTGYEACAAIKADQRTQHIPVVFLSAKGQEAEIETGMDVGATAYLLKPFAPDILLEKIEAIIKEHVTGA
jgi:CheY-like chemotaxis protein